MLNETKADLAKIKSKKLNEALPEGYEQHWNCSIAKKGYSGVALFSKIKPIQVTYGIGVSKHDQEGRVITAEFPDFCLVVAYVPNAGEGLKRLDYRVNEWDKDFQAYLNGLKKPVLLTGDLNVAHHEIDIYDPKGKEKNPGFSPQERQSFSKFLESGYVDTFRKLHPSEKKFSFWTNRF